MAELTIGEKSALANSDNTAYSAWDIGNEMVKDIQSQIEECAEKHKDYWDSDEYCVVMLLARDPVILNAIRRKFYAWPFLPKPRTNQTTWLYNRITGQFRMLWCLPDADTLASLSCSLVVDKEYKNMKRWSDSVFTVHFWQDIRKEHNITMLSEEEHLEVIRKENPQLTGEDISPLPTNPIDSLKFDTE